MHNIIKYTLQKYFNSICSFLLTCIILSLLSVRKILKYKFIRFHAIFLLQAKAGTANTLYRHYYIYYGTAPRYGHFFCRILFPWDFYFCAYFFPGYYYLDYRETGFCMKKYLDIFLIVQINSILI